MKIVIKIIAFLLIFSVSAEKLAFVFMINHEETLLVENEESKKGGQDEESDNQKKIEEPDKYTRVNQHTALQQFFAKSQFDTSPTPLHLHPFNEDDTKPPKAS
jgi:hypothetical protein